MRDFWKPEVSLRENRLCKYHVRDTEYGTTEFLIDAARGVIDAVSLIDSFAENPSVGAGPEDIWDGGGLYNFATAGGTWYVSSSDDADTQEVEWMVLTEDSEGNWNLEIASATLQGQTKTELVPDSGNPIIRVSYGINRGSTDLAGTVYLYEDDTVTAGVPDTPSKIKAQINMGNNCTMMAIYTVPTGKTALFLQGHVCIGRDTGANPASAVFTLRSRPVGEVFSIKGKYEVMTTASNAWQYAFKGAILMQQKTDILIRCDEISNSGISVLSGLAILVMDN